MADYNQARKNKNASKISDLISDRFLYNGATKQMAVRFLSGVMDYTSEAEIMITRFEPRDDGAEPDVWLKDKYFEFPSMTGSRLNKENEKWKWYGNQRQR